MADVDTRSGAKGSGRDLKALIPAGIVVGLVIWFAVTNFQSVEVNFWVVTTTAPLFVVIVLCLILGLGIGYVAGRRGSRRRAKD